MLTDYFEPFTLLRAIRTRDAYGGVTTKWVTESRFNGALVHETAVCYAPGGHPSMKLRTMLLHNLTVFLNPEDRIRLDRTGDEFRVTGRTRDMRTPANADVQYAQVPVEEVMST